MSLARVTVLITKKGVPCEIDNNPQAQQLYVYVLKCDGKVLEWCGRKYVGLQARCGILELEIPPGCYVIGAVENPSGHAPLGNHLTHIAIVRLNCGDETCVTLFNPTFHFCTHWWLRAANGHVAVAVGQALTREAAVNVRNAIQAMEGVAKTILPDAAFTTELAKQLDQAPTTKGPAAATKSASAKSKKGRK